MSLSPATLALARRPSRTKRRLLALTSLGLAGLLAGILSGCSTASVTGSSAPANSFAQVAGNWQFSSSAVAAARLSTLGGSLAVNGSAVNGILHPLSSAASQCLSTSTDIPVTGSIDAESRLSLTAKLAGGTLALSGTLSSDRRSLSAATYTITGGSCAMPAATSISTRDPGTPVTGQQYQPVSGTYTGTLTSSDGGSFPLTSTLTQTSQPDADGIYHVQGTASSAGNKCVPGSLPATASTIAGGSISTTYTDSVTGASITGTGASSPDGSTITVTNWTINGSCGSDSGTGTLTRQ